MGRIIIYEALMYLMVLFCAVPQVSGSEVIGSDEPVRAVVGDNVILPCHLKPPVDVTRLTVEWKYNGEVVHMYKSRKDNPDPQNDQFKGRTSLFHDEMHKGNISLKLTKVTLTDAGNYICFVPKLQSQVKKDNVELIVDSKDEDRNVAHSKATSTVSTGTTVPTNPPFLITGLSIAAAILIACVVPGLVQENRRQPGDPPERDPEGPANIPMM